MWGGWWKMKLKQYLMLSVIVCVLIITSGCTNTNSKLSDKEKYSVAVVKTPKTNNIFGKTKIEFFNQHLKSIKTNKYSYGGVGRTNFGLPIKKENIFMKWV